MNYYNKAKDVVQKTIPLLPYRYIKKGDYKDGFKVNIVNHDPEGWIFTKFANEMYNSLKQFNINVTVQTEQDRTADINHHIFYGSADFKLDEHSSVMITHVDCERKYIQLKKQLNSGAMGICMSRETMERLISYRLPRNKLCYINPAHDGIIRPRKYIIGITHRVYSGTDYRKRDDAILDVCNMIDFNYFKFCIMGSGWEDIVEKMISKNFEVDYYPDFDKEKYNKLMPTFDFFYYDGTDEGSMGYLDALAAGIKTLVTAQGFHLDMGPATHYCDTIEEFGNVLNKYAIERENISNSVRNATWENYTYKHLEIWAYMCRKVSMSELLQNRTFYKDGIFSCLLSDILERDKIYGII